MKNLVLGSLLVGAATQAAGCVASSTTDTAHVEAHWKFENIVGHVNTTCPTGFDTAAVHSQELDATLRPVGAPIIDLFNCSDMAGITAALPPSWFEVYVNITDHSGASLYAQSAGAFVDVTTVNMSVNIPTILNDGGYFHFQWALVGQSSGAPLSCASAGATGGVEAISTDVSSPSNAVTDIFNCTEGTNVDAGIGEGFTAGLPAATYTVSIDALNSAMQAIGTAPALTNKVIARQNVITELGTVSIPITGH